jgi:hypothetical protein
VEEVDETDSVGLLDIPGAAISLVGVAVMSGIDDMDGTDDPTGLGMSMLGVSAGVHAGDGDEPGRRLAEGAGERGVLLGTSLINGI